MKKDKYQRQPVPSFAGAGHPVQRSVPFTVMLSVLFNNLFGYMGLAFAGFGMIFCIIFTPMVDFTSFFYFGDDAAKTTGIVTDVNSTNVSVNDATVIEYRFTFSYMGKYYTGTSYSTAHNYRPDQNAPVEFEPDSPSIARIEGMSVKPVGLFVLFVYIFPLAGLVFLFASFRRGIPAIHAIKYGVITRGKFTGMKSTGGSINRQTVYDLYFSFKDRTGKEYSAAGRTHKTWLVRDEPEERIIYDPDNPSNAVVIDAMPKRVRKFLSSEGG
ncbi:MAG TPA: hypothetical protein PK358_04305 [Spirochaetota bacterium]|nr:hypothetical protein [Spirochaetota bacterium]HPJ34032.1 hypothetical protein [Spirochaetota bacterium]